MDICRATEVSEKLLKSLHKETVVAVAARAMSRKRLSVKPEKQQGRFNRKQNVNSSSASPANQISCNKCENQHEKENVLYITKLLMSVGVVISLRNTVPEGKQLCIPLKKDVTYS